MKKMWDTVLDKCQAVLRFRIPLVWHVAALVVLKWLYTLLAVLNLQGAYYEGIGSYQIHFVFWKECLGTAAFAGLAFVHLRWPNPNKMWQILLRCLFLLYFLPLNAAFALNNMDMPFFFLTNIYAALILGGSFLLSQFVARRTLRPLLKKEKAPITDNVYVRLFCAIMCLLFVVHKFMYNGWQFTLSTYYADVYANRAAYDDYLQAIGGTWWGYVLSIVRNLATAVAPFYLLISLVHRRPIGLALATLTTLSMFAVSSGKSSLLMWVLVVALFAVYKTGLLQHMERLLDVGVALLLVWCLVEALVLPSTPIYTVLVRRQMYMPAWLDTIYYRFFSGHTKVFWTQDTFLLKNLLSSVATYKISPLYVISQQCFNGAVPSPNTGMFAEAYMHFGMAGALIYPPLLIGLLWALTMVFARSNLVVQVLIAVRCVMQLTNVPVLRTDSVLSWILFAAVLWVLPVVPVWPWLDKLFERRPFVCRKK